MFCIIKLNLSSFEIFERWIQINLTLHHHNVARDWEDELHRSSLTENRQERGVKG